MIKTIIATAATALALTTAASAGWDRSQVIDPAFDRSLDRQIELAAERGNAQPVTVSATASSAIATNDAAPAGSKHYFGANVDRFVDSVDSPYNN